MPNKRIFYACQGVSLNQCGIVPGPDPAQVVHGLQSVGMTTNFNLEQAFELGQLEIYENIEGTPDIEVTLEKVLDGNPLLYHLATTGVGLGSKKLANRSKQRTDLRLGIFDEGENALAKEVLGVLTGQDAQVVVHCSGMYVSSVSYSIPTDGNCTESVTLVGNEKEWLSDVADHKLEADDLLAFDSLDMPASSGAGGVQRREDVILVSSILPEGIQGVNGMGAANGATTTDLGTAEPLVHLQSISISTDFSREEILELGRKVPYYRPANFPIEVSCEIEAITTLGDYVGASEKGNSSFIADPVKVGNNTAEETIFIHMRAGYAFDLGTKNRLSSVSYGGGDAGGGNVTTTYSYTNFNDLDVQHKSPDNLDVGFNYTNLGLGSNT